MPALRGNTLVRWTIAVIVVFALVYGILDQGNRLSGCREELRAQAGVVARLERRISELESERAAHESSRRVERAKVKRWLERAAIPRDAALSIARADAAKLYRDSTASEAGLAIYDVQAALEIDGWHVDYVFKPEVVLMTGGGMRYVIDPLDGAIVSKLIEQ